MDICVLPTTRESEGGSLVVGNLLGVLQAGKRYRVEVIMVEDAGSFPDANFSTPPEIAERMYGYSRVGASTLMQRYALLAGDPHRSDNEDKEQCSLKEQLVQMGLTPGWDAVRRARSSHGK